MKPAAAPKYVKTKVDDTEDQTGRPENQVTTDTSFSTSDDSSVSNSHTGDAAKEPMFAFPFPIDMTANKSGDTSDRKAILPKSKSLRAKAVTATEENGTACEPMSRVDPPEDDNTKPNTPFSGFQKWFSPSSSSSPKPPSTAPSLFNPLKKSSSPFKKNFAFPQFPGVSGQKGQPWTKDQKKQAASSCVFALVCTIVILVTFGPVVVKKMKDGSIPKIKALPAIRIPKPLTVPGWKMPN